jgi:hypothetical protein
MTVASNRRGIFFTSPKRCYRMRYGRREVNPSARQTLCPSYSICLTSAVNRNSTGFVCTGCSNREERERINPEEIERAGLLLRSIFFSPDRPHRAKFICPRCGIRHTHYAWSADPSPRRFCTNCIRYAEDFGEVIDHHAVELRSLPMSVRPALAGEIVAEIDPETSE